MIQKIQNKTILKPKMPKCWKVDTKPSTFCPGCGQSIILKMLGYVIDELKIAKKTVYGCDIGCMLLSWNFFDVDIIQAHHGRITPVMVGLKRANPRAIAIAYMGDGGAYAIGAQHLVAGAMRNENITVIVANNTNYAMTGGQEAPTTIPGEITATTPFGADNHFLLGPEMVRQINKKAYIARGTTLNPLQVKGFIKKAIQSQISNKGFSFVEILSGCPINWKTDAKKTIEFLKKMEKYFPLGEVKQ